MGSTRPETMQSGTRQPGPSHDATASVSTRRSTTGPPTKPTQNGDNNTRQQPETNHQPLPEKPTSLHITTYNQSFDIVNQIKVDDVAAFLTSEEASSEQIAEDNGLIDRARTQAENLLTAHVATARGDGGVEHAVCGLLGGRRLG